MKPVGFVICFSLGVSLMLFSGYLPQSANARGQNEAVAAAGQDSRGDRTITHPVAPRVTAPHSPGADSGGNAAEAETVPESPPSEPEPFRPEFGAPADSERESENTPPPSLPVADAGADRVVWRGWDELALDGSASAGEELLYAWRQVAGPLDLLIADPFAATTTATGLLGDPRPTWRSISYRFELTVTAADGQMATDEVTYTVKSAPGIKLRPAGERRFDIRDGYQLAHFTAWITNLESYETTFEMTCDTELTFTRVSGGLFEVTGGKASRGFLYQVTLYPLGEELSSFVEFLVDSDEQVPAIVQLGVNWE